MKKNVCLLSLLLLVACQQQYDSVFPANDIVPLEQIQAEVTSVSMSEAEKIAASFYGDDAKTRATDRRIEAISVINDDTGRPAIYVVNYADDKGFVLISATKNFMPILAYSDKGHFTVGKSYVAGLNDWMENMGAIIETVSAYPVDSAYVYKNIWKKYLQNDEPEKKIVKTRQQYDEEFADYVRSCYFQWASEGYSVCLFCDFSTAYPFYERFRSLAQSMTYPEYDYTVQSIVRSKTYDKSSKKDNFVFTTWDQLLGFNAQLPQINGEYPYAGCATIAMAQVMKYHEYPTTFDWNAMPNNYATPQTAGLIRELGDAIHAKYGLKQTPASLDNVRSALVSKYGYASTTRLISHSADVVEKELNENRPVIMEGFSPKGDEGHAWVATGYDHSDYYTEYELMVMPEQYYPGGTFVFLVADSDMEITNSRYFYMNWGWYGKYDGFYYDANIWVDRDDGRFYFNKNRRDMVGIQPK